MDKASVQAFFCQGQARRGLLCQKNERQKTEIDREPAA